MANSTFTTKNNEETEDINIIFFVIMIVLVVVGFIGNNLILLTMCSKDFSHRSTSVYLVALSLSDTLSLFCGTFTVDILSSSFLLGVDIRDIHIVFCWLCEFFWYWAPQMSSWCLVAITVERLVVILKPHR